MTFPRDLREHVVALLEWSDAHVSFDDAVTGLPAEARGRIPQGLPYSPWQLVEHIRLTQADILEFCGSDYGPKQFPQDYWPESPEPPSDRAWNASLEQIRSDRRALQDLARDSTRDMTEVVPAGAGQTLLRELLLAADHAAYHIGELVVARRLLGNWGEA